MRVLLITPVGIVGGAERSLLTVMIALQKADPTLELHLIVGTEGELVQRAEAIAVRVQVLPLPELVRQLGDSALKGKGSAIKRLQLLGRMAIAVPALLGYLLKLRGAIAAVKPDLVHSNGLKTHLLTAILGVKPLIWHLHDFYSTRPVMVRLLRRLVHRVSGAIAVSQAVAADVQRVMPGLLVKTIYNAVDTEEFSPVSGQGFESGSDQDFPGDRPLRVGLVATFARWKGQDVFLRAIAQLSADPTMDGVQFYVIGGAIYETAGSQWSEAELRSLAESLGIGDRVTFLGFQADMVATYRWLDVVVHASTQPEPFGLVIAEAMACGKPVIVAQAGGAAELFTPGVDAIAVPANSPTDLAQAIRSLATHPGDRLRLGAAARQTALHRFGGDRLGQEVKRFYHHLKQNF